MKTRAQRHQIRIYRHSVTQIRDWACRATEAYAENGYVSNLSEVMEDISRAEESYKNLQTFGILARSIKYTEECRCAVKQREKELIELLEAEKEKIEILDAEAQALIKRLSELEDLT